MRTPTLPAYPTPSSPRLALVLGSGGVRSAAAIGIGDVLARAGLRPEFVAGCSSGALFGATVALGLSPEMALRLATSLWSQELTGQKRWRGYAQLVAPRAAGFDARHFSLRSEQLIVERLDTVFGHLHIEELRTPLVVAATDAASGAPVQLTRGPLARALQASMAVPFLFPSVEFEGRQLVDGVVSDPLPLAAAGSARVIVALGFRGQRVIALELDLPARIGLWETAALPAACDAGRRAALAALPEIERSLAAAESRAAA